MFVIWSLQRFLVYLHYNGVLIIIYIIILLYIGY